MQKVLSIPWKLAEEDKSREKPKETIYYIQKKAIPEHNRRIAKAQAENKRYYGHIPEDCSGDCDRCINEQNDICDND